MSNKKLYPNAYTSWVLMRQRCYNSKNPSYKYYGGRGIKICERWMKSFNNFLEDMSEPKDGMTIDRKNNNRNYYPENCKWATRKEQSNNTRQNHIITFDNLTMNISQWAEKLNINKSVLFRRINLGWKIEDVLNCPVKEFEKYIEYNGQKLTIKEWSKKLNIPCYVIRNRLNCSKWSIERTLTTPSIKYRK